LNYQERKYSSSEGKRRIISPYSHTYKVRFSVGSPKIVVTNCRSKVEVEGEVAEVVKLV